MFLVYMDDSGDEYHRCFSALMIHESVWREALGKIRDYRRNLKISDGVFVTKEFHATDFVAGRGRIASSVVTKARRNEIFRETLRLVATLPKVQIINGFSARANERQVFERMMNRVNRTMAEWKSNALIICDQGKDYTGLVRRMSVYNPIASQFGTWPDGSKIKNIPTTRIIEESFVILSSPSSFNWQISVHTRSSEVKSCSQPKLSTGWRPHSKSSTQCVCGQRSPVIREVLESSANIDSFTAATPPRSRPVRLRCTAAPIPSPHADDCAASRAASSAARPCRPRAPRARSAARPETRAR